MSAVGQRSPMNFSINWVGRKGERERWVGDVQFDDVLGRSKNFKCFWPPCPSCNMHINMQYAIYHKHFMRNSNSVEVLLAKGELASHKMLLVKKVYNLYNLWFHVDVGRIKWIICIINDKINGNFSIIRWVVLSDPRTKGLFLLGSPWPMLAILSIYLFIVNGNGQRWMLNRKPFDLTRIINVFNLYQITANAYVFAMVL